MQNAFFEAICRMGIFMICVRAILHFRPQEVYEKYLRLLAGIMILIQLFLPVGRLILGSGGQEAAEVLEDFRQQLQQGMEEAVEDAEAADALLEQMTLEEVQRRLEEQKAGQEGEITQERGIGQEKQTEQEKEAVQERETGQAGAAGQEGQTEQEKETAQENGQKTGGVENVGKAGEETGQEREIGQKRETEQENKQKTGGSGNVGKAGEETEAAEEGEAGNKEGRITVDVKPIEPVVINAPEAETQEKERK